MQKRKIMFAALFIGFCAAVTLQAQGFGPGMMNRGIRNIQMYEKVTLSGNLVAVEGRIALKASNGKTYYVRGIQQLIGFVDGLKEGASVEIEGGAQTFPAAGTGGTEIMVLHAEKLTIGGKVYDKLLTQPGSTASDWGAGAFYGRMRF